MDILDQPWEDVASDVTDAIEKAVQPLIKKAVDDIYGGLLDTTQDYLKDNLAFNIASRIGVAEREASDARQKLEKLISLIERKRDLAAQWQAELRDDTNTWCSVKVVLNDILEGIYEPSDDEVEAYWIDRIGGEPPLSADEQYRRAAISKATGSPQ